MLRYKMIIEKKYDRMLGFYDACGIVAEDDGEVIETVRDISPDREKVEKLVRAFNDERLSLSQLEQVIEEFLYDFEV